MPVSPWVLGFIAVAGFLLEAAVILVGVGTLKGSLTTALAGTNQRIEDMNINIGRRIDEMRDGQGTLESRVLSVEKDVSRIEGQMEGHMKAAAETALARVRPAQSGSSHA